jgi:hypothetical protein
LFLLYVSNWVFQIADFWDMTQSICSLFNISNLDYIVSNDWMITN